MKKFYRTSGIDLQYDKADYDSAKRNLREASPDATICYEDVLLQILREGGALKFVDLECDGEYTREVRLEDVHQKGCSDPNQIPNGHDQRGRRC